MDKNADSKDLTQLSFEIGQVYSIYVALNYSAGPYQDKELDALLYEAILATKELMDALKDRKKEKEKNVTVSIRKRE